MQSLEFGLSNEEVQRPKNCAPSNELRQGNTPKYGTLDDLARIFGGSEASQLAKDLPETTSSFERKVLYTKSGFSDFNPLLSWAGSLTCSYFPQALATTTLENRYSVQLGDIMWDGFVLRLAKD